VASERSIGKEVEFKGKKFKVFLLMMLLQQNQM
jgi:hypothetical protein